MAIEPTKVKEMKVKRIVELFNLYGFVLAGGDEPEVIERPIESEVSEGITGLQLYQHLKSQGWYIREYRHDGTHDFNIEFALHFFNKYGEDVGLYRLHSDIFDKYEGRLESDIGYRESMTELGLLEG